MSKRTASGREKYKDVIWISDDEAEDDGELSYTDGGSQSGSESDESEELFDGDSDDDSHNVKNDEEDEEDDLEYKEGDNSDLKSDEEEDAALERDEAARRRRTPSASPPRRGNVLLDLLADTRPETPDQSRFNSLPRDIKYLILSHFDQDSYSIVALSLCSRSWYKALNQGSTAEIDWQRRCNAMGSVRKSPHCKTWRETFIRQVQKHCLSCLRVCKVAFGHLVHDGPGWMVVCEACQKLPGPWHMIPEDEARRRADNASLVQSLPFRAQKIYGRKSGRKWQKLYLASAVQPDPYEAVVLPLKALDNGLKNPGTVKTLLSNGFLEQGHIDDFRRYISNIRNPQSSEVPSRRFLNMLAIISQLVRPSVTLDEACRDATRYLTSLRATVAEVERRRMEEPGLERKSETLLFTNRPDIKKRRTWLDAILLGEATVREYLVALRQGVDIYTSDDVRHNQRRHMVLRKKAMRKFVTADNQPPKSKKNKGKKKRKIDQPPKTAPGTHNGAKVVISGIKVGKRGAKSSAQACQQSCGKVAAKDCGHKCCGICCPGPCVRHKRKQKIGLYAAKKEEIDE